MARSAILKFPLFPRLLSSILVIKWSILITCCFVLYFLLLVHKTNPVVRLSKSLAQYPQSRTLVNEAEKTTKDVFHIVTAASSKEFEFLLKLIHSITKSKVLITLWLWSLDLSLCEISFIKNLNIPFFWQNFQISIQIFWPIKILNWLVAASGLHQTRGACRPAEWPC